MRKIKGIDDTVRMQIIEEYLEGASKYSLVKKYKLGDAKSICQWMLIFGIEDPRKSPPPCGIMAKKKRDQETSDQVKFLELEIKKLRKELAVERIKAEAYDTMIEIAEKEFNIPIRKKSDTKQSKN